MDQQDLPEWIQALQKPHEPWPSYREGIRAEDGWYRVEVLPDALAWIMEQGPGLWRRDLATPRTSHRTACICVAPKLLTLLKLKWA